jgi:hypothetical protein
MGQDFEKWIIEQNMIRFRELLKTETDLLKRQHLEGLLAREEAKLRDRPPAS